MVSHRQAFRQKRNADDSDEQSDMRVGHHRQPTSQPIPIPQCLRESGSSGCVCRTRFDRHRARTSRSPRKIGSSSAAAFTGDITSASRVCRETCHRQASLGQGPRAVPQGQQPGRTRRLAQPCAVLRLGVNRHRQLHGRGRTAVLHPVRGVVILHPARARAVFLRHAVAMFGEGSLQHIGYTRPALVTVLRTASARREG